MSDNKNKYIKGLNKSGYDRLRNLNTEIGKNFSKQELFTIYRNLTFSIGHRFDVWGCDVVLLNHDKNSHLYALCSAIDSAFYLVKGEIKDCPEPEELIERLENTLLLAEDYVSGEKRQQLIDEMGDDIYRMDEHIFFLQEAIEIELPFIKKALGLSEE